MKLVVRAAALAALPQLILSYEPLKEIACLMVLNTAQCPDLTASDPPVCRNVGENHRLLLDRIETAKPNVA